MRKSITKPGSGLLLATVLLVGPLASPALAGDAGAFLGGMVAGKLVDDAIMDRPQQQQTYSNPQPVQQASPPPAQTQTPEQRLQQLDKLAAGGYITPEEYKRKRQAIINSM